MTTTAINGHALFHETAGDGEPVVLIHGSWSSGGAWSAVAEQLRETHRLTLYDRLGHARSARPGGEYTRRHHEDDLAALIEDVCDAPAHLVGNSYAASMAL